MERSLNKKDFICNRCFVTECLDMFPNKINETKCAGVTEEESNKGISCKNCETKQENPTRRE